MDDFTPQIRADGGDWTETEILGNHAIVKVRASDVLLSTIAATEGFIRLPKNRLDDSLSDLTTKQKKVLKDKLESLGYSLTEIRADLGNDIGTKKLRDVLKLAAKRRLKPRYDKDTDTIILDGPEQPVRPLEDVDGAVI